MKRIFASFFFFLLSFAGAGALAQDGEPRMPDFLNEDGPRARLLLLGIFHFDDAGLDDHKPGHAFDVLSETRQKEIEEVVALLKSYGPTRIAVEVMPDRQSWLDEKYREHRTNNSPLGRNEIYQIGFRLAQRLGHEQLYAVDAKGRSYFSDMTAEQWEARVASLLEGVPAERIAAEAAWDERFEKMYDWEDKLTDEQNLREHFIYLNDDLTLNRHHGHYLVGLFKLGRGDDWFGADVKTRWYNRNLRIFHNLLRITEDTDDRILLVIGSGHVPILRHAALSSPDFELVEVRDVLAKRLE